MNNFDPSFKCQMPPVNKYADASLKPTSLEVTPATLAESNQRLNSLNKEGGTILRIHTFIHQKVILPPHHPNTSGCQFLSVKI